MHFKYINLKFSLIVCSFVWQTDSILFTFVYLGMNIFEHIFFFFTE